MRALLSIIFVAGMGCGTVGLQPFDTGGVGTAALGMEPSGDLRFGRVSPAISKSVLEELLLYSAGDTTLAIVDVYLDESTSGAFSMRNDLPLPLRLEPGREFPVELRFAPFAVGSYAGELVVLVDDGTPEGEQVRIDISGQGCEDPEETGNCGS